MYIILQNSLPRKLFLNMIPESGEDRFLMSDQTVSKDGTRITIRHVAEDAGVSVAAVSKVLRNAYGVSPQLRQKVELSIEKLNYRPSIAARAMRGQTHTIGILVIELSNPFLPSVIESANERLAESGYKALIGMGRSVSRIEASMIEAMIDSSVDGVLLIAPHSSGKMLEKLARQVPMVVVAHHEHAAAFDTVNSDDHKGAMLAVEALLAKGHRDIAMVSYEGQTSVPSEVVVQREAGFVEAMEQAGLGSSTRIIRLPPPGEDRSKARTSFLSSKDKPRAVFVWSDLDAIPLLAACHEAGVRVPEDMAIIGYDNSPPASIPLVGLSSIDQNPHALGARASELLLSRIEGREEAKHLVVQPRVVLRRSV